MRLILVLWVYFHSGIGPDRYIGGVLRGISRVVGKDFGVRWCGGSFFSLSSTFFGRIRKEVSPTAATGWVSSDTLLFGIPSR